MSEPAGPAPLDLLRLRQYTGGDDATEREILDLFLLGARGYFVALTASVPGSAEWRRAAHALKGSAGGVGAGEVAALAAQLETVAADEVEPELTAELARLETAISRTAEFVALHYPPLE